MSPFSPVGVLPAEASSEAYCLVMFIDLYAVDDKTLKSDYGVKGKAAASAHAIWGVSAETKYLAPEVGGGNIC